MKVLRLVAKTAVFMFVFSVFFTVFLTGSLVVSCRLYVSAQTLENDKLLLTIDDTSLKIDITNKESGYTWSSGREILDEERLNNAWRNRVNSGVTVDYYDKTAKKAGIATVLGDDCTVTVSKQGTKGSETVTAKLWFSKLEFGFDVTLSLSGGSLTASISNESIVEGNYVIKAITLFPFLGSTNAEEFNQDGYIFVPDGSGALIEYGKRSVPVSNPYKARVYGGDISLGEWTYGNQILVPIFGIVNGVDKNAFYAEAVKGSAYAEVYAYPSGVMLGYNWAGFTFYYRQNYFQQTSRDGSGFSTIEENSANYDISVTYTFLSGSKANYSGIAADYRNTLVSRGVLTQKAGNGATVHLSMAGAEMKKSFLWTSVGVYTTVSQAIDILDDLTSYGITPAVTFTGYYDGGYGKLPLHKTNLLGKLGNFADLTEYAENKNIPLYYSGNYMLVNYNASGVSKSNDLLRTVDNKTYRESWSFNDVLMFDTSYLSIDKISSVLKKDLSFFNKKNMGIAVLDAGRRLYTDYGAGKSREQAMTELAEAFSSEVKTAFYSPNSYMWQNTDSFFNMYMSSTGYLLFTQDVPFLQILLKGYIDLYSEPLNASGDITADVLKLIEYGTYPSYYVTNSSPADLINTPLYEIFSSEYRLWNEKIKQTATLISSVLSPVQNAVIISHKFDAVSNTAVTVYNNGMEVLVNYGAAAATIDGNKVAAKSAVVCEVGK